MSKFIAHRGLSSLYYQNSEDAFLAAGKSNFFYGIETDVWLTSDGHWVCCHDAAPFENRDVKIAAITLEEALKLPMNPKKWGNARQRGVSYICTTKRYLEINKKYGKVAFIELKTVPSIADLNKLVDLTEEILGLENAVFISFHARNLERLRRMDRGIKTQILTNTWVQSRYYLSRGYDVDQHLFGMNAARIHKAHQQGREVNVWTVRNLVTANRMYLSKADYITTDYDYSRWFKKGDRRSSTSRFKQPEETVGLKLFKEGKNCCQSVVLAFADTLWLNKRRLKALSAPFGHGIDICGNEICGAATGMLMIIGITHPRMNKKTMNELVQKALDEFREKTGGLCCHEFTRDKDLPEGAEIPAAKRKEGVCEKIVETAILIAKKHMP